MTSSQLNAQREEAEKFEENREYKCPDCGGLTSYMGIDFKAPKNSNMKAWKEARKFIESGKVFYRGTKPKS